jgi:hypothetical protein
MTESFPARSGNRQTYAFPPYVSGELSGRVTTLAAISGESAIFGPRIGPGVPVVHAMRAQAVVLRQNPDANLPRCNDDEEGENDRHLAATDTKI